MGNTSFFTNLGAYLEAEALKVEAEIKKIAAEVGPYLLNDLESFATTLAQIAIGAVLKQALLVLSGSEKFGAAVTDVVQQVEINGKQIEINDAQAVVQQAYQTIAKIANS